MAPRFLEKFVNPCPYTLLTSAPHITVKKLPFLLHILETLGSNLSPNIDYLDPNILLVVLLQYQLS